LSFDFSARLFRHFAFADYATPLFDDFFAFLSFSILFIFFLSTLIFLHYSSFSPSGDAGDVILFAWLLFFFRLFRFRRFLSFADIFFHCFLSLPARRCFHFALMLMLTFFRLMHASLSS